jgi:histone-lysine N-methyltransferase SETD1
MSTLLLRVPIEELLVICRNVHRLRNIESKNELNSTSDIDVPANAISIRGSYSFVRNTYEPDEPDNEVGRPKTAKVISFNRLSAILSEEVMHSIDKLGSTLDDLGDYTKREGFIATRFVARGIGVVDFCFGCSLEAFSYESSAKVITKIPSRTPKKLKRLSTNAVSVGRGKLASGKSPAGGRKSPKSMTERTSGKNRLPPAPIDDIFRPTSSRLLSYNVKKRKFNVSASDLFQWRLYRPVSADFPEVPRNLRFWRSRREMSNHAGLFEDGASGGKKLTGRAARAEQRRMQRNVAAMGMVVDTLAGRETQLRFDRSGIHDWGVFVDIDVKKGEMIVEYRGELIGNAMAEKREKEYEDAKIGSDYMFRIDELTVCDATKQGNVARFINASCDPNCYTKIITLDNTKRIVIYAKKDIPAGTELCYDYKFSLEYDPTQRIPCGCGAENCRGFLNWDKRLADISQPLRDNEDHDRSGHRVKRIKGVDNDE